MIKYLTRADEKTKDDYLNHIQGYRSVKAELSRQLQYLHKDRCSGNVIPGFVLVGRKHHGKHFMMDMFLKAVHKKAITVDNSLSSGDTEDLQSFLDRADRDELVIVVLNQIDKMACRQIEAVCELFHDSEKSVYVLGIAEEDGDQVKLCRTCGLIEYSITVTEPFLRDTEQFIEYMVHEKYKHVVLDMDMKDLAAVTYSKTFREVDQLLQASIRESKADNQRSVGEKHIMDAVMRRYYTVNTEAEYLTEKKIRETSIHEAGHAVMAEILKPGSVGYVSIWLKGSGSPLGSTMIIREDIDFKGSMDEVKIALAGIAAEEICNGYISPGCGGDIKNATNILTTLIGREGCYGLEYMDSEILRSEEQQTEYNRKVRDVLLEMYEEVKRMLESYKSTIMELGNALTDKDYLIGRDIRSKI